jgi:hypothetical protein
LSVPRGDPVLRGCGVVYSANIGRLETPPCPSMEGSDA